MSTHKHATNAKSLRSRSAAERDLAGYREKGYWTEYCACGANRFAAVVEDQHTHHVGIQSGPWSGTAAEVK